MPNPKAVEVEELSRRLGLPESAVQQFRDGEIVTSEMDACSDKDLSLVVVAVVDANLEETWEWSCKEKVADIQEATVATGDLDPMNPSFDGMELDEETLKKLASDPGGTFFMSKDEAKKIKAAAKNGKAKEVYYELLADRAKAYWELGLAGVKPYEGKGRDPAKDIENANKATHKLLETEDPILREEFDAVPSKSSRKEYHKLIWSIQKGRDQAAPTLTHVFRYKLEDGSFLVLRRCFYSAYDYDASQLLTGVLPTADGRSAVFYTNHTFCSKVAGFGGSAKRSIGRKMMKGKLVATFEKGQKALAKK